MGYLSPGPKGKFSIERSVCAPQYESAGTWIGPKLSVSVRVLVLGMESFFVMPTFSRHPPFEFARALRQATLDQVRGEERRPCLSSGQAARLTSCE